MVELLKKENGQAVFKFSVSADVFDKALVKAYNKSKGKFRIPGFRAGKAPLKVIEKHYGEGVFFEEAVNIALPDAYSSALKELDLDVIDRPDIDILEIEKGQDVIVEATVALKPEVELGAYKGVEVEVDPVQVTEEDIDEQVESERKKNARMVVVEDRAAQKDDTLLIDYKGSIDGEYFEGGTAENHTLKLGSNAFIGNFEEQLEGLNTGDEKLVEVSFPEDYHAEHLAGKAAKFEVVVKEIKFEELPELDDEFVKDISEFDTLDEYRADAKEKLTEQRESARENAIRNKAIECAVDNALVDIPDVMIESEISNMLMEFDYQLRYQGMDLKRYFEFTNTSEDDLKEKMRGDAEIKVKTSLVIETIAKAESIEASQDDIQSELEKIAEMQKMDMEQVEKTYGKDDFAMIKDVIVSRKAVDFIVSEASVK